MMVATTTTVGFVANMSSGVRASVCRESCILFGLVRGLPPLSPFIPSPPMAVQFNVNYELILFAFYPPFSHLKCCGHVLARVLGGWLDGGREFLSPVCQELCTHACATTTTTGGGKFK